MTGYHVYIFSFVALFFHFPFAFCWRWSWRAEARALRVDRVVLGSRGFSVVPSEPRVWLDKILHHPSSSGITIGSWAPPPTTGWAYWLVRCLEHFRLRREPGPKPPHALPPHRDHGRCWITSSSCCSGSKRGRESHCWLRSALRLGPEQVQNATWSGLLGLIRMPALILAGGAAVSELDAAVNALACLISALKDVCGRSAGSA